MAGAGLQPVPTNQKVMFSVPKNMSTKYKFKNSDACYFISFATIEWIDVFTRKDYKNILVENLRYCQKEKGLELFGRAGKKNNSNKDYQFWRQDNHPIEVWSEEVINQKLVYLHNNPIIEAYVDKAEEYLYSIARDYYYDRNCEYLRLYLLHNEGLTIWARVANPCQPDCLWDTRASGDDIFTI